MGSANIAIVSPNRGQPSFFIAVGQIGCNGEHPEGGRGRRPLGNGRLFPSQRRKRELHAAEELGEAGLPTSLPEVPV